MRGAELLRLGHVAFELLREGLSLRAPRIYTNTSPARVRGSIFRWFFEPWTPAGLVLVYILGSRTRDATEPENLSSDRN